MNLLFIGDVFGSQGRSLLKATLPELIEKYQVGLTIANGENAAEAQGLQGLWPKTFSMGVDVITSGNHIWDKRDFQVIDDEPRILRPANYPSEVSGKVQASTLPGTARR